MFRACFILVALFLSLFGPSAMADGALKEEKDTSGRLAIYGSRTIDFVITNPNGKRTGYNPQLKKQYKEFENGNYHRDFPMDSEGDTEEFMRPEYHGHGMVGDYKIEVYGLADGAFKIESAFVKNGGGNDSIVKGNIKKSEVKTFIFEETKSDKFQEKAKLAPKKSQ